MSQSASSPSARLRWGAYKGAPATRSKHSLLCKVSRDAPVGP